MDEKRSETPEPIRIDFVPPEALGSRGRLGMTSVPGGEALRDFEADLREIEEKHRAGVFVSLMEPREYEQLDIPDLLERAQELGFEVLHLPIPDGGTPADLGLDRRHGELVEQIVTALGQEKTVVIHCRGGLGRTGLVAASVLVALGHSAQEAILTVQKARPGAIENPSQVDYLYGFEIEVLGGTAP